MNPRSAIRHARRSPGKGGSPKSGLSAALLAKAETRNSKPTVFLVDDDPLVTRALSRLLHSAGYDVEAFASAGEFLDNLPCDPPQCDLSAEASVKAEIRNPKSSPGCILLDILMPGLSGLDLQKKLAAAEYCMPIIFITGHGDIPMSVEAMKGGAVDFLTKPIDGPELLRAVKAALSKDRKGREEHGRVKRIRGLMATLTPREREVMTLVVRGMLNKQIAGELEITEKTVKVHRSRVMEKMKAKSVADLVKKAQKAGS